jgi:hypothetical protein
MLSIICAIVVACLLLYKIVLTVALIHPKLRKKLLEPAPKRGYLFAEPIRQTRSYKTEKRYDHQYLGV